jgi:predicted CopG family antitoxin
MTTLKNLFESAMKENNESFSDVISFGPPDINFYLEFFNKFDTYQATKAIKDLLNVTSVNSVYVETSNYTYELYVNFYNELSVDWLCHVSY